MRTILAVILMMVTIAAQAGQFRILPDGTQRFASALDRDYHFVELAWDAPTTRIDGSPLDRIYEQGDFIVFLVDDPVHWENTRDHPDWYLVPHERGAVRHTMRYDYWTRKPTEAPYTVYAVRLRRHSDGTLKEIGVSPPSNVAVKRF